MNTSPPGDSRGKETYYNSIICSLARSDRLYLMSAVSSSKHKRIPPIRHLQIQPSKCKGLEETNHQHQPPICPTRPSQPDVHSASETKSSQTHSIDQHHPTDIQA